MIEFIVIPIIFFALFVQGAAGFGSALLAMPLLVPILGVEVAAPLFALVILTGEIIMIIRYRHALHIRDVWRLMVSSLVGIPLGVIGIRMIPEPVVLLILGVVTAGYALYALSGIKPLRITNDNAAYGFGFLAGLLGGAYNTAGPPYIIYITSSKEWTPAEFKSNLQAVFFVSSIGVIIAHFLSGNFTLIVIQHYLLTLPAAVIALVIGFSLDGRISPQRFRKIIMVLLVLLGLRLIYTAVMGFVV